MTMKLSTRGRYGLRAVVDLAARGKQGDACVPLRAIAAHHGMSEYYLEQLFAPLKKAGLVASVRGAAGGYRLCVAPNEITAGDVLRVLEGSLAPVDCVDDADAACAAADCQTCNTKTVWARMHTGLNNVLNTIKISDLADEAGASDE
jgi:Rrf2 family protein